MYRHYPYRYTEPHGGVITLSLQWSNKHPSQQTILLQKNRGGRLRSTHQVIGWNVELCGLKGDIGKFSSFLNTLKHASLYNTSDTEVLKWHINWTQIKNSVTEQDQFQAIQDERNQIPMQFITKYLTYLQEMRYKIVTAPTIVASEQMSVWTLSYEKVMTQSEAQLVRVVNPTTVPAKKDAGASYRKSHNDDDVDDDDDDWSYGHYYHDYD